MEIVHYLSRLSKEQNKLFEAVLSDSLKEVTEAFQPFSELNAEKKWFDYWLLVLALKEEQTDIADFLIQKYCKVRIPERTDMYCTPVYYACRMWDYELAERLITNGASIHDKDANKITPVELAVQHMDVTMIDMFLRCYNDGSVKNASWLDQDIFQLACWRGYTKIVKKFIDQGINFNSRSVFKSQKWKGFSPLHFAVDGKHPTIYHLSLRHGANIYSTDERGDTSLHLAFKQDKHLEFLRDDIIQEYSRIFRSSKFENPENEEGLTLFHVMCSMYASGLLHVADQTKYINQHLDNLRFFIDNGIDINKTVSSERPSYSGYSALHFAVSSSSLEISKLLLERGADPKKADKMGRTPLHLLCETFNPTMCSKFPNYKTDHEMIVKLLLENGAEIHVPDLKGNSTPLHSSFCNETVNNSLIDILLSQEHANINHTNSQGLSYFHIACSRGQLSKVMAFVSKGVSVDSHTNLDAHYFTNWSALHFAVYFNQKEIVDFLLARGADVNIKISHSQMTPLHFACEHRYTRFFQFSLPSDKSSDSLEPFDINWEISRKNQYGIIESLLRYGASVNYKDCTGHSPLLLACRIPIDQIMKNYHGPHIAQDYYRKSVLNEIRVRQEYIVDILLRHGAEFRDRNFPILHGIINDIKDNETFAAGEELMYKLLGEGVDVNSVFSQKLTTPLHFVTESCPEKCALKIITVLLSETNIDVNAQNSSGDTPLHIAVRKRKAALVQKFLDSGVDINVKNTEGHTAIHSIFNPPLNYRQDANYISVLGRLSIHVKKLEQLKFFVSKEISQWFKTQKIIKWATPCKIELELKVLKLLKVDTYTTLYDILRKDANDMSKHVKNADFELIMRSLSLPNDYPVFHKMLELQYRKGIIRDSILENAKSVLNDITKVDWPDPCSDYIFKCLTNIDLENLIRSTKFDQKAMKRKSDECLQLCTNPSKVVRIS